MSVRKGNQQRNEEVKDIMQTGGYYPINSKQYAKESDRNHLEQMGQQMVIFLQLLWGQNVCIIFLSWKFEAFVWKWIYLIILLVFPIVFDSILVE